MNQNTNRIVGLEGIWQQVGSVVEQFNTQSTSIVDLHRIVIPKFTFDKEGREFLLRHQGVGSGAAGTKNLQIQFGFAGSVFAISGITMNNLGYYLEVWGIRTNHNTLKCVFHQFNAGFAGAVGVSMATMTTYYTTLDISQDLSVAVRGSVSNAADTLEAHATSIARM